MTEDISTFLAKLHDSGKIDSSGAFTLDIENTVKKLSQFRLTDPRLYVLNLIACATARGASWIQVEIDTWEVRLGFDGPAFTRSELHNLFHSVYETSSGDLGCADLALGLLGSRAFNPEWVVFETWDGRQGHFVQLYEDQLYIQALPGAPWSAPQLRNCFRLREAPVRFRASNSAVHAYGAALKHWWERRIEKKRPEASYLRQRCCFGPLPLWINGQQLAPPTSPWANLDLVGSGPCPPLMARAPGQSRLDSPLWGRMQLTAQPSRWHWLIHGVSVADPRASRLPPGFDLQVHADQLSLDLSHSSLVENPALQQARQDIQRLLPRVVQTAFQSYDLQPGAAGTLADLKAWSQLDRGT